MRIYYTDVFVLPLPPEHRFPMEKYRCLRERVADADWAAAHTIAVPPAATDEQLRRVHTEDYVARATQGGLTAAEVRRLGFPWTPALIERSRRSVGATIAAAEAAVAEGRAVNLAGGTHHAFPDAAEGYCVFNDAVVAARALQAAGTVGRVAIVDADVHQGNGSAACAAGDGSIFTFSIHGQKNFPARKVPGDLDIGLPDRTGDVEFLEALREGLDQVAAAGPFDLVIYLAGADPYFDDRFGRLALTKNGLARRDRLVFSWADRHELPCVVTMAGGYAQQVADTVDIHFQTVRQAAGVLEPRVS